MSNKLHRVKQFRNNWAKNQEITAREFMFELENLIKFFDNIVSEAANQNAFSQNKEAYLTYLEQNRI